EPQVFIGAGHYEGRHAPGDRLRFAEVLRAGHHALLAHGRAVQVLRASAGPSQIGFAPVGLGKIPATESATDIEAARRRMFEVSAKTSWTNSWWMDPVFLGRYPEDGLAFYGNEAPPILAGDMETIAQPVDFFGVNIYEGQYIKAGPSGEPEVAPVPVGHPITGFNWNVTPEAMYWALRFFHERYKKPLVITENGISCRDWVSLDGQVHDPGRIDFTQRYLLQLHRAVEEGVPVLGYFHWSILDNFEWAEGYKQRFGMVFVDYPSQKRILKDSARWYREVIQSNGRSLLSQG
ncbi:MAG TPA: family 1 glycosylhydrolase, partial [Polyangiaceae bacterium]